MRVWLRSLLTVLFAIGFASIAQADKRVALIVGNGDYRGAALGNPTFDADLVAASLQSIGFVVKVVKNADLGTFDRAVTAFAEDAQGAEVALFYFAGHGFTVNEGVRPVSLLMSTSADVTSSSDRVLRSGGIALDEIVSALAGKAQATLVFVDACRNDPRVSRSVGSQARGFAPLEPVQGGSVFIGLSTRLGSVARDGAAGMGSPFARAFAVHIQTKGIRIDDAFRQLRDAVKSETEGDQIPDIVQDDLPNGAITLVGTPQEQPTPSVPADPGLPPARADGAMAAAKLAEAAQVWATVRDSNDVDALTLFSAQYQGTFYAKLADLRLKQIQAKARPPAPVASLEAPPKASDPSPLIGACDRLAASPSDVRRPAGIAGVNSNQIDAAQAVPACRAAIAVSPNDPRLAFQLARALDRAGGADAEAFELYRRAAEAGHPAAMNNLGSSYGNGKGTPKDAAEAARWYRKAADAGVAIAMGNLGVIYENGTGVPKDAAEAVHWYEMAADAGDARGMTSLGVIYENGIGVSKDFAEAVRWYRKAADAGDARGMTNLGVLLENGAGAPKDEAEAVQWYRKAADAGYAAGMTNLGLMYASGKGIPKDEAAATQWFQKGADAGDARGMLGLGVAYQNGAGVPRDAAEAARWFRKVDKSRDARIENYLGWMYANGTGLGKDIAEALKWYRKAAALGNLDAQINLGDVYKKGNGVPKNVTEAVNFYHEAAAAGSGTAMYDLGKLYEDGDGIARDEAEAAVWYQKAADAGYSDARGALDRITSGFDALKNSIPADAANSYGDELKNFGVGLNKPVGGFEGKTPNYIPNGHLVTTLQLMRALRRKHDFAVLGVWGCNNKTIKYAACFTLSAANFASDDKFRRALETVSKGSLDHPLVLYCARSTCWMSFEAAQTAIKLGYRNVFWYRGGMDSWKLANGELADASQKF